MIKFERTNKSTDEVEDYIGVNGKIVTIAQHTKANTNDTPYFRFTAELDAPSGPMNVAGQLYEALVPHLGGMPKIGDKMQFNSRLSDLQEGLNTRWNIGGSSADEVTDSLLDAINAL